MKNKIKNIKIPICLSIRNTLFSGLAKKTGIHADWVQSHLAICPRCQQRLAGVSRVGLAFDLIRNQPQKLHLLSQANQKAISVLKHSLRNSEKADQLKAAFPQPSIFARVGKYHYAAANVAACLMIFFLVKTRIFNSIERFQDDSENALKNYYSVQVGKDIAEDIFPSC